MSLRYHAITIVAMFLMLSAGMIIGAFFVQSPALTKTRSLISGLRDQAKQQKADLNNVRSELYDSKEQLQKAASTLSPMVEPVVAGQMKEKVAIIQVGDYPDAAASAAQALRLAGANVSATFALDPTKLSVEAQQDAIQKIASLASEGIDGRELRSMNGVTVTSDSDQIPRTFSFVIVGGHHQPTDQSAPNTALDSMVIQELQKQNRLKLVGVEPSDAEVSSVPLFIQNEIPSVDCIDLSFGQMTLPALFTERGAYGLKKTADDVIPDSVRKALLEKIAVARAAR